MAGVRRALKYALHFPFRLIFVALALVALAALISAAAVVLIVGGLIVAMAFLFAPAGVLVRAKKALS